MKVYTLKREIILKAHIDEVWEFFSSPQNLNEITPDDMNFEIKTDLKGVKMHAGLLISYTIRPILNIPFNWVTEISHCEKNKFFVDEQRFGPYAFWHHQHHFEELPDSQVKMTDIVNYAIGWGFIGRIANSLFIAKKVEGIFEYRNERIPSFFP